MSGPLGPDIDRHGLAPGDLAQDAGVARRLLGADIAPDRGHGQQVERGRGEGGQQPRGVVHAGVAIDDERLFHRPALVLLPLREKVLKQPEGR